MVQRRELTRDTLVWKEGMPQWTKAGTIKEALGYTAESPAHL
jgi:hypothetical protein